MNTTGLNNVAIEPVESWLDVVGRGVGSLDFGLVQFMVHGSRVVQTEHTGKIRLETPLRRKTEGASFARQTAGGRHNDIG